MPRLLSMLIATVVLTGCQSAPRTMTEHANQDVHAVASMLAGVFDSRAQAASDPTNFFEIRLVTIPIWGHREDGRWLYVEQAAFSALDRPYRQRVYRIYQDAKGQLWSDVFELPDPAAAVACWLDEVPLDNISPDDLALREGCSILLERDPDGGFTGSTIGQGCSSSLRGASHATSRVTLNDRLLMSWDQGWNTRGEQVWGATAGGYHFVRQASSPN